MCSNTVEIPWTWPSLGPQEVRQFQGQRKQLRVFRVPGPRLARPPASSAIPWTCLSVPKRPVTAPFAS